MIVLIGDVAGKGVEAAGLTETVRSTVRAFASIDPSPDFILTKTNEVSSDDPTQGPASPPSSWPSIFGPGTHSTRAPAILPPCILTSGSCHPLDVTSGPPLRSFPGDYACGRVTLSPGDHVVFYTDGVTEARRGMEFFEAERLTTVLATLHHEAPQAMADAVLDAVSAFAGELRDDLLVLALRFSRSQA